LKVFSGSNEFKSLNSKLKQSDKYLSQDSVNENVELYGHFFYQQDEGKFKDVLNKKEIELFKKVLKLIKDISTDFDQLDIQFQESFKLLETTVSKQYNTALINSRLDPEKFAKLV
jgi:hypothetical protein